MRIGNVTKQFEILPEGGPYNVVLAEIQDLGLLPSSYTGEDQEKVRFVFVSDQKNKEGEPIIVLQTMTNSLNEKSTMRKTLKGVLGKDPGDTVLDSSELVGKQCQITVTHSDSNGRTYANVTSVFPRKDGGKVTIPHGWQPPQVKKYKAAERKGAF